MKMKKTAIVIILIAMLLSSALLIRPAIAEEPGYQNISVQQAKHMIKHTPNLLILDARNQSEYEKGHLNGALLMPLYRIESYDWNNTPNGDLPSINLLQAHVNDSVIVYCKGGSRSAPACQILAEHGFTKIYNMQGGITAWMQAEFPIYTKYHYASVDVVEEEPIIQIEPWLLYESSCTSCQNQTCASSSVDLTNRTFTALEQSENHTAWLMQVTVNNTIFDFVITKTLLLSNIDLSDGYNRTMSFSLVETTSENVTAQLYELKYEVKSNASDITIQTILIPGSEQSYNSSLIRISYTSAQNPYAKTKEVINFTTSAINLSQEYQILSKVTKKLAKTYEQSEDNSLRELADDYYTLADEVKHLSRLVNRQIPQYNLLISNKSIAVMGMGLTTTDPDLVTNGGFDSGSSYWTLTGYGEHTITSEDYRSSPNSLRLGWKNSSPTANTRDSAYYQLIYIPEDAVNIRLTFMYHFLSYDGQNDLFEVYVAKYGQNPSPVFLRGGITRGVLDDFGWWEAGYNLDFTEYAGSSVYIYFDVYNRYDNYYQSWCYLDNVALTYDYPPYDYLACLGFCAAGFCMDYEWICEWFCSPSCLTCIIPPHLSCIPCGICIAGFGAYCLILCAL